MPSRSSSTESVPPKVSALTLTVVQSLPSRGTSGDGEYDGQRNVCTIRVNIALCRHSSAISVRVQRTWPVARSRS